MQNLPLLNPALFVKRVFGRIRRNTTRLSDLPITTLINGQVRFEHKRLPFLTEENLRAMLTNTYDINLCDYLRRHLSTGDVVLDAGANIGYISAVAGSLVGQKGEVHGFEPLQECFARLQVLASLNPQFRFVFNNCALGEEDGVLPISIPEGDARNATLVSGKGYSETRQVAVKRLDNYIVEKIQAPERIKLIKMDVQGFELPVLRGLKRFFQSTGLRPLIACDMKPWELHNLGWTLEDFESYMRDFGYSAWNIVRDSVPIPLRTVKDWQAVVFKVM